MRLRAAALAGSLLLGFSAWPALAHSGADRRPGATQFDLEVKINAELEPAVAPKVVADTYGNLYAVARKETPASPDSRASTGARASSWRWTSKDGGATWESLPGEVETAPYGTVTDVAAGQGKVYVYDAPLLLRWDVTGLGKVAFAGAAPVPGASPLDSDVTIAARGDRDVFVVSGTTLYASHDGGQTFAVPGYPLPGADRCRLAVDKKTSVYVTCLDGNGSVDVHVSHDNGTTFARSGIAPGSIDVPPVAVTPDGTVYVLRNQVDGDWTALFLLRSSDGGKTWTERRASDDRHIISHLSLAAAPDGRLGAAMYITGNGPGWFIGAGIFKTADKLLIVSFADHSVLAPRAGPAPEGMPGATFLPDSRLALTWTQHNEPVPGRDEPLLQDAWFVRSQRPGSKSQVPDLARTPHYEIPRCTVPYQVTRVGDWQSIRAPKFKTRSGGASDELTAYVVDPFDPRVVYVSNGTTIMRSDDGGCRWREVWSLEVSPSQTVPVSAATGRVVALASPEDRREHDTVYAVVAEKQQNAEARSHVVRSPTGEPGSFVLSDTGLPPVGAPGLFRVAAANPEFLYLTVGNHLYASEDYGANWSLRTALTEVASAAPITAMALDPLGPNNLYAVWSGALHHSRDGGRTWTAPVAPASLQSEAGEITAVDVFHAVGEAPQPVAWSAPAGSHPAAALRSADDGVTWHKEAAVGLSGPVESAVHGSRPDVLVVSTLPANDGNATVASRDRKTGAYVDLSPVEASLPFRVTADRRGHPTFYGISPLALFRYAGNEIEPPPALDEIDDTVYRELVPAPIAPVVTPAKASVSLPVGFRKTVPFSIEVPSRKPRIDVLLLVDTSESMDNGRLPQLRREVMASLTRLAKDADVWAGVAQFKTNQNGPIYRRERDVGPLGPDVDAALAGLTAKNGGGLETQLIGLDQAITGAGQDACGVSVAGRPPTGGCLAAPVGSSCEVQPDAPLCSVQPGQQANWRDQSLRVVVNVTDTTFRNPEGTPRGPDGRPDLAGVAAKYREQGVLNVGVAVDPEGIPDLAAMATLTGAVAPRAGLSCGPATLQISPGKPAVCPSAAHLDYLLMQLLRAQLPTTHLHVQGSGVAFNGATPKEVEGLDLTAVRKLHAQVTVSCKDLAPGFYDVSLSAEVHDEAATAFGVSVECVGPPAHKPPLIGGVPPLLPPGVPAAPAPPPANVNPNIQTQVQTQVQPQAGSATQEDEQVELALAEADRGDVPAEMVVLAGALGVSAAAAAASYRSQVAPQTSRRG